MGKFVVIVVIGAAAYFFWQHSHENGRVQACWVAGQNAGYTGNFQRADYEGSEKASANGVHVLMFLPRGWNPADTSDGTAKAYICGIDDSNHVVDTKAMVNGHASM
jgi:hypothetical protein